MYLQEQKVKKKKKGSWCVFGWCVCVSVLVRSVCADGGQLCVFFFFCVSVTACVLVSVCLCMCACVRACVFVIECAYAFVYAFAYMSLSHQSYREGK